MMYQRASSSRKVVLLDNSDIESRLCKTSSRGNSSDASACKEDSQQAGLRKRAGNFLPMTMAVLGLVFEVIEPVF